MVIVQLTNGFGNNLFQYIAARLLAEFHGQNVRAVPPGDNYYATPPLKKNGVDFNPVKRFENALRVGDDNYKTFFDSKYKGSNFFVSGYFEDYTYFKEKIDVIKSWFPKVEKRKDSDLVIHFRAGDRLFYKNEFYTKPSVESYLKAIEEFDFDNLHIVTDMPEWKHVTEDSLSKMSFHKHVPESERVSLKESVEYFNSVVDGLSKYEPKIYKGDVGEDFNFIRTFKNILFQHGTLGWWAAVLSEAEAVGVYGPWREWKGQSNKNLSKIGLQGWFQWE